MAAAAKDVHEGEGLWGECCHLALVSSCRCSRAVAGQCKDAEPNGSLKVTPTKLTAKCGGEVC